MIKPLHRLKTDWTYCISFSFVPSSESKQLQTRFEPETVQTSAPVTLKRAAVALLYIINHDLFYPLEKMSCRLFFSLPVTHIWAYLGVRLTMCLYCTAGVLEGKWDHSSSTTSENSWTVTEDKVLPADHRHGESSFRSSRQSQ